MKHKNVILIIIALILFAYAAFISIIPAATAKMFNKDKFTQKALAASGLNVTFNNIDIRIEPTFRTTLTLTDLKVEFPDSQPVLKAGYAELTTSPAAIYGKTVDIKKLVLKNVKYDDLILPNGINKIAYLPGAISPKYFGKNKLTIISGPVSARNIDISYTKTNPYSYTTKHEQELSYNEVEVRNFLQSQNFANLIIK